MSEEQLQHSQEHEREELSVMEGERGIPAVGEKNPANLAARKRATMIVVLFTSIGLVFLLIWKGTRSTAPKEEKKTETASYAQPAPAKTFGELPPAPNTPARPKEDSLMGYGMVPAVPPVPPKESDLLVPDKPEKKPAPRASGGGSPKPRPPTLDKGQSPLMATSGGSQAVSRSQNPEEYAAGIRSGAIPLSAALPVLANQTTSPSESAGAGPSGQGAASFLGDRNFILAQGSFIDCVLQTKLDSTVAGMTSCVVSRNIFSDNGKVLLIERGSTVSGEYQADIQQGQARLYVLWTRIKTPTGVVVDLQSPGTDPLGGAGVPGRVNNHFFARFGSALLLSLVDDAAGAAVAGLTKDGGTTFNFGNTAGAAQGAATEVIKSTTSIKPTLTKNQGEVVGIYVARDLDFSGVYRAVSQ